MSIINTLNNRELATAFWAIILVIWVLYKSETRAAAGKVLRTFFTRKIIFPLSVMLLYIFFVITFFRELAFWDASALKDTIVWTAGTAVATYFGLTRVSSEGFLRVAILENIKLTLILEFTLNLYSFPVIGELIILPIFTIAVILHTSADLTPGQERIETCLDCVLSIFGILLFIFTVRGLIVDFQNFTTLKTLRDFLLPPLFSIMLAPFLYVMALYIQYENIFVRVDIANKHTGLAKSIKQRIFQTCHINLLKLHRFSKCGGYPKVSNKGDVETLIKRGLGL